MSSKKALELPADMIRASVNMMVAAILISIATSKVPYLPYVTFMVAMGTSLSVRAWSSQCVYRVAGVLNVIGGGSLQHLLLLQHGLVAFLIHLGGPTATILIFGAILILVEVYIT